METEETAILRQNPSLFSTGSLHMRGVGGAEEALLTHCFDIDASLVHALHNSSGNLFVEIEPNFSGYSILLELRWRGLAGRISKGLTVSHVFVDIGAMIKIVRECGTGIG